MPNGLGAQTVRQVPGADDLHPVRKHHEADRRAREVVAVNECVDEQFFERRFGDLELPEAIEPLLALHMMEVAADEREGAHELLRQRAIDVFAVDVPGVV